MKKVKRGNNKKRFFQDKLPVIALIAAFLVFTFLLAGIGKPTGNTTITGEVIDASQVQSQIQTWFTKWEGGNLDTNIAKYLFFFMLAGLIWGALNFAKFPPKSAFQAIIALPVAFLATAYITPEEVFSILQSYTTLGIVLTFIMPFIVMIFVSAMLLSNETLKHMSVPKIMLEIFLWLFFVVVLGFKMIEGMVLGKTPVGLNLSTLIMVASFGLSLLILVFNGKFRKQVWKLGTEIKGARSEAEREAATEAIKTAEAVEKARK